MNEPFWHMFSPFKSNSLANMDITKQHEKQEKNEDQAGLKLLVAEDSVLQQAVVSLLLKRLGHTISTVADGFEAVSAVQMNDYDVILMDCQMPLMNGFEATRFIRKIYSTSKRKREIVIIAVTTNDSPEDCFEAGMDYFLQKPLKRPILEAVLGRLQRDRLQARQTSRDCLSTTLISG